MANHSIIFIPCRYSKPISVAKRVLERTKVNILVGSGATKFAKAQGFPLEINESLLIPETLEAYKVILFVWSVVLSVPCMYPLSDCLLCIYFSSGGMCSSKYSCVHFVQ